MKRNLVATILLAGTVVAGMPLPTLANAAEKSPTTSAPKNAADKYLTKVSSEAFKTLRSVHAARVAIFNGLPKMAEKYVAAATVNIAETEKTAAKYAVHTKKKPLLKGDMYVPFDESLSLAESFIPTKEKATHIAKANELIKRGKKTEALEVLRLAQIDIVITNALLPVQLSKTNIINAARLIKEGKYYQANLALKAVEDSTIIDSLDIDDVPSAKTEKPKKKNK